MISACAVGRCPQTILSDAAGHRLVLAVGSTNGRKVAAFELAAKREPIQTYPNAMRPRPRVIPDTWSLLHIYITYTLPPTPMQSVKPRALSTCLPACLLAHPTCADYQRR